MDEEVKKALEFLETQKTKKKSILHKYNKVIIAMIENDASYEVVLKYLCKIDEEIKNKYEKNKSAGIKRISAHLLALKHKKNDFKGQTSPQDKKDDTTQSKPSLSVEDLKLSKMTADEVMEFAQTEERYVKLVARWREVRRLLAEK